MSFGSAPGGSVWFAEDSVDSACECLGLDRRVELLEEMPQGQGVVIGAVALLARDAEALDDLVEVVARILREERARKPHGGRGS